MNKESDNKKSNSPVDILLICALKDEFDEVLEVKNGVIDGGWNKKTDSTGRIVAESVLTDKNEGPLTIRATWVGYMGREQIQSVASRVINNTSVKCLAMSGICAGRRGKVELGDVIFGERLWSYDSGKSVIEDGQEVFQYDMLQYRPTEICVQHMQEVKITSSPWLATRPLLPYEYQENWVLLRLLAGEDPRQHVDFKNSCPDWADVLKRLWDKGWVEDSLNLTETGQRHIQKLSFLYPDVLPKPEEFRIHVAPIATGAAVKEDEELFPKLSISMRKVLGVEMEASGLAALAEAHQLPAIIAKGVSDYGDKYKDDRYRKFAARASAEALILLLRNIPHLFMGDSIVANQTEQAFRRSMANVDNSQLPLELIDMLADLYPDVTDARSLWERAGGKARDVENVPRSRDLWQRLWRRCCHGAVVRPTSLLGAVLEEYPDNGIVSNYLKKLTD